MKAKIKRPDYYQFPNGVQVLDITRYLDNNTGNVVKYVCRAGRKIEGDNSPLEMKLKDLLKAREYLDDEIRLVQEQMAEETEVR